MPARAAGMDPRILAALSSQRPNAAQMAFAQVQAQNEAAEQVTSLLSCSGACAPWVQALSHELLSPCTRVLCSTC